MRIASPYRLLFTAAAIVLVAACEGAMRGPGDRARLYDNAYCKVWTIYIDGAIVRCFAANGTLVDVGFTALLGS